VKERLPADSGRKAGCGREAACRRPNAGKPGRRGCPEGIIDRRNAGYGSCPETANGRQTGNGDRVPWFIRRKRRVNYEN
jgi:hypothetical protein